MKKLIKISIALLCMIAFAGCGCRGYFPDPPHLEYVQYDNKTSDSLKIVYNLLITHATFIKDSILIEPYSLYKTSQSPVYHSPYFIDLYQNDIFFKRYDVYDYISSEEKSLYNEGYYVRTDPSEDMTVYTYTFLPEDFE
jgi:predicted small lipoprotein YifL